MSRGYSRSYPGYLGEFRRLAVSLFYTYYKLNYTQSEVVGCYLWDKVIRGSRIIVTVGIFMVARYFLEKDLTDHTTSYYN